MMAKHLRRLFIEVDMKASQVADKILRDGHLARVSKLSGKSVEELEEL